MVAPEQPSTQHRLGPQAKGLKYPAKELDFSLEAGKVLSG